MFPFSSDQFAPKNCWYVAAFSDEVTRTPMERWVLDAPIALYRKEDGTPVALDGRCPHHFYPLGKSSTVGDNIRCGYHGLEFAPDGRCVASPFLETIPTACRISSYVVVELWQWIWIWPGDPALADESLIPDHGAIGLLDTAYETLRGFGLEVAANYQLLNDNLLDLQHVEVLHGQHIGSDGFGRMTEEMTQNETSINSVRLMDDMAIPPVMEKWFGGGRSRRKVEMTYYMPGFHAGIDLFDVAGNENVPERHPGRINVYHAVTPARPGISHYFTAIGRDFARSDPAFDQAMRHKLREVLQQDIDAAEAVEKMIQAQSQPREMLFRSDATVVAGRRMLQRAMIREAGLAPT